MRGLTNKIYLATLELVSCLPLHFTEATLLVSTDGGIMEQKC